MKTPTKHLAEFIKYHTDDGKTAVQIMYSAFKELQLTDDIEPRAHPEVLKFLDQLRFDLMDLGSIR